MKSMLKIYCREQGKDQLRIKDAKKNSDKSFTFGSAILPPEKALKQKKDSKKKKNSIFKDTQNKRRKE